MNYECGGPVEGGLVIKRAQEDSLVEHIIARDLYIPICGGRQTGKTTLMYQLRDRLRSLGMGTAYLYLGGMEDDMAAARFYEIICGRIIEDTNTCLTKDAGKPNIQHVLDQAGFQDFIKWLVLRTVNCKRLVIMLDEVGGVPSKLATSFWGCLRNMFTQRGLYRKVIFLLAGELDMNHLATANNSPLINVCVSPFIELMDFTIDQVKILVEAGLPESSLFTSAIYYWTDGHPYLTQKLCHLVQQAILHDPQYIDVVRREKSPLADLIVRYFINDYRVEKVSPDSIRS